MTLRASYQGFKLNTKLFWERETFKVAQKDNQASEIQPGTDLVSILRGKSMTSAGSTGSNKEDVSELIMRAQRVKDLNSRCKTGITFSDFAASTLNEGDQNHKNI